ncbi:MAG: polyphosphate polymerase domain-containing protein [Acidobacteriota bacterium]|nr:polyphosphate polymerase domain-containing protein [Acidobacteriota bacterium]
MTPRTHLHFNRYEFKYILEPGLRRDIERELNFFMALDPFVAGKPDKKYTVRSLYFDNRGFTHYYDKIDGQLTRSKFRLRTYTRDPAEPCAAFLEIKGRHNNIVFKHRTPLDMPDGACFAEQQGGTVDRILRLSRPDEVLQQFRFELARRFIKPVMLIDYRRRPYVSRLDPEFRVTFDEQLYGEATEDLFPDKVGFRRSILTGKTVLEVKFRYHVPSWFHRIIQTYELHRISISKICKGIETFGLAPALD